MLTRRHILAFVTGLSIPVGAASLGREGYVFSSGGMQCQVPLSLLSRSSPVHAGLETFQFASTARPRIAVHYPFVVEKPHSASPKIWIPLNHYSGPGPTKIHKILFQKFDEPETKKQKHLLIDTGEKQFFLSQIHPEKLNYPHQTRLTPEGTDTIDQQLRLANFRPYIRGYDEFQIFNKRYLKVLAVRADEDRLFLARPYKWKPWQDPAKTKILGLNLKPLFGQRDLEPSPFDGRLVMQDPLRRYEINRLGHHRASPPLVIKDIDRIVPEDLFERPLPEDAHVSNPFLHWLERNLSYLNEHKISRLISQAQNHEEHRFNLERLAKILYFVRQGYLGQEQAEIGEYGIKGGGFLMGGKFYEIRTREVESGAETHPENRLRELYLLDPRTGDFDTISFRWRVRR